MEIKTCSRCLTEKPITQFRVCYKEKGAEGVRSRHCKDCRLKITNPYDSNASTSIDKTCTICRIRQPKTNFYKSNYNLDGHSCICKICDRTQSQKYSQTNVDELKEYRRMKKQKDKLKRFETDEKYRLGVLTRKYIKDHTTATQKPCSHCRNVLPNTEFYTRKTKLSPMCRSCTRHIGQMYSKNNPQKSRIRTKRWADRKIENRIYRRMSRAIWGVLRKSKNRTMWLDYVDYTISDLKKHIESRFTIGMDWDVFATGKIHIDHIIPASWFTFTTPHDQGFKDCWSLSNLQPMWQLENCSKNNRYVGSFNPNFYPLIDK
jgi:hypothetical protein